MLLFHDFFLIKSHTRFYLVWGKFLQRRQLIAKNTKITPNIISMFIGHFPAAMTGLKVEYKQDLSNICCNNWLQK